MALQQFGIKLNISFPILFSFPLFFSPSQNKKLLAIMFLLFLFQLSQGFCALPISCSISTTFLFLLSFPPNAARIFPLFFFFFFLFFLRHVICYVFLFTVITCFNKCSLLATIFLSLIMYSIFFSHSLLSEGSTIYKLCFSVDLSISFKL